MMASHSQVQLAIHGVEIAHDGVPLYGACIQDAEIPHDGVPHLGTIMHNASITCF